MSNNDLTQVVEWNNSQLQTALVHLELVTIDPAAAALHLAAARRLIVEAARQVATAVCVGRLN